jgi:hypothetical protein
MFEHLHSHYILVDSVEVVIMYSNTVRDYQMEALCIKLYPGCCAFTA